ncbi:PadR family transcriptional regulator [Intestinibacter sp.]
MRTLKYAILGLMNQKQMTGYDLTKQFESTLNEFWHAKHSQIYPELKKLTEEGLIEYHTEISGSSLKKKVYSITENGKKDLHTWLLKSVPLTHTPKDEFRLKVFFFSNLKTEEELMHLQTQLSQHEDRLQHLRQNMKKFSNIPEKSTDEFGDYLVLLGAIMREETNCEWLKKCIELINCN